MGLIIFFVLAAVLAVAATGVLESVGESEAMEPAEGLGTPTSAGEIADSASDSVESGSAEASSSSLEGSSPPTTLFEVTGALVELRQEGVVRVGVANEIPYGYVDEATGRATGEAPEVARAVFAELGVPAIEPVVVEFGALIGDLLAGKFDVIAAGMFINESRAERILFSDPDYCVLESMLVPEGNPYGLTNYTSVADTDAKLAVASGTVTVDYATWAGVPSDQITEFPTIEDQYAALAEGRVDAVSGTFLTVQQHAENMEGFIALPPFPAVDQDGSPIYSCGGFGFRPENQELRDVFNTVLNRLQQEGTIQDIVADQFGIEGLAEPAVSLTAEDLTR